MTLEFSEKFDHQFSHVFIFGNMFPEMSRNMRVAVSLLCHLTAVPKIHVSIYNYLISEGRRNCTIL